MILRIIGLFVIGLIMLMLISVDVSAQATQADIRGPLRIAVVILAALSVMWVKVPKASALIADMTTTMTMLLFGIELFVIEPSMRSDSGTTFIIIAAVIAFVLPLARLFDKK